MEKEKGKRCLEGQDSKGIWAEMYPPVCNVQHSSAPGARPGPAPKRVLLGVIYFAFSAGLSGSLGALRELESKQC